MKWTLNRQLAAPVPGLPQQTLAWTAGLEVEHLYLGYGGSNGCALMQQETQLRITCEPRWDESSLPPPPWRLCLRPPPDDWVDLTARFALGDRIRLFPRPSGALDWAQMRTLTGATAGYDQAIALALFDLTLPLRRGDPVLDRWVTDLQQVLHERRPLTRSPELESPLLDAGYRLLRQLSDLREQRAGLDDFIRVGEKLLASIAAADAFGLVFWGEAAYCLTDRGEMSNAAKLLLRQESAARRLQEQVPNLAESIHGGLWQHHLGRLAYYRGRFDLALRHYAVEWRLRRDHAGSLQARLYRAISNVLADMGLLDPALAIAREAETMQRQIGDPELYKTRGRQGEIHARQGHYAKAQDCYLHSWELQGQGAARDGRTAVYLGNVALLTGDLAAAAKWFAQAELADAALGVAFNPYAIAGRTALAARAGEKTVLARIWAEHRDALTNLRGEKVLPRAIACNATYHAGLCTAEELKDSAKRLIDEQYAIEALPLLASLHASPGAARTSLERVAHILEQWNDSLLGLPADFREWSGIGTRAQPAAASTTDARQILTALKLTLEQTSWAPLQPILPLIFPLNLVSTTRHP